GVLVDTHVVLARIHAVGARHHFEQQGVVGHGRRHRSQVIDGRFDRHRAGVGHQPVRRLHAVATRVRTGHAHRTDLVAVYRHLHSTRTDQRRATRRRAAGRIAVAIRVVHRTTLAGVAAA